MLDLTELFCYVDDVCQTCDNLWNAEMPLLLHRPDSSAKTRQRPGQMSDSERCTILIAFHQSSFRNFKHFYLRHVSALWYPYFPNLLSYQRFVAQMPLTLFPLIACLKGLMGKCTGLSFIDAMAIPVCHNRRIPSHRVFEGVAARGKTSMGWFYGFKLHLVINECGQLVAWTLSPGNVDDRKPVPLLMKEVFGKVYGDKGYISQDIFKQLFRQGIELVTNVKKNMKNRLLSEFDKLMLRKRALIETVNDQLQNISMIEHTRHRSLDNFLVNVVCALIAYCLQPKKPSIQHEVFPTEQSSMPVVRQA